MGNLSSEIDVFIDTAISRLSSEDGSMLSHFFIDLRETFPERARITQALTQQCIDALAARGLTGSRVGDGLQISVNLATAFLTADQAASFNVALAYAREVHGKHL